MCEMKKNQIFAFFLLAILSIFGCQKNEDNSANPPEESKSSEKQIQSFTVNSIVATIDENTKIVALLLPYGSDVSKLSPVIVISDKASVTPISGIGVDFTDPVVYTVKAEDGTTVNYTVQVAVEKNDAKSILSFVFPSLGNISAIAGSDNTLHIEVPFGTDVTRLVPEITISTGAICSPKSGVEVDFTNPVTYTVKAEDGTTKEYTVKVDVAPANNEITSINGDSFKPNDTIVFTGVFGETNNMVYLYGLRVSTLTIISESSTHIEAVIPDDVEVGNLLLYVKSGEVITYWKDLVNISYGTPTITSISSNRLRVGESLVINGNNFRDKYNIVRIKSSAYNKEYRLQVTEESPTSITVTIPEGVIYTYDYTLSVQTYTYEYNISYEHQIALIGLQVPEITSMGNNGEYILGLDDIIFNGINFADNTYWYSVNDSGTSYSYLGSLYSVNAEGTTGILRGLNFRPTYAGKYKLALGTSEGISNIVEVTLKSNNLPTPILSSIDAGHEPSYNMGDLLTLRGANFSNNKAYVILILISQQDFKRIEAEIVSIEENKIICRIPHFYILGDLAPCNVIVDTNGKQSKAIEIRVKKN